MHKCNHCDYSTTRLSDLRKHQYRKTPCFKKKQTNNITVEANQQLEENIEKTEVPEGKRMSKIREYRYLKHACSIYIDRADDIRENHFSNIERDDFFELMFPVLKIAMEGTKLNCRVIEALHAADNFMEDELDLHHLYDDYMERAVEEIDKIDKLHLKQKTLVNEFRDILLHDEEKTMTKTIQ
jgi:hypothetical protein